MIFGLPKGLLIFLVVLAYLSTIFGSPDVLMIFFAVLICLSLSRYFS
jgi:hypothetical protein